MNQFVQQKIYRNTPALNNAANDIDEKLKEIKDVEKRINRCFELIKQLRKVIQNQNVMLDSINDTMDKIQNSSEKALKTMEETEDLYMTAYQVN